MPVVLTVLKMLGSTLVSMALSLLTGPMIKKLIIMAAEFGLARYEAKAKASPDQSDDATAAFLREVLTAAEKEWESDGK